MGDKSLMALSSAKPVDKVVFVAALALPFILVSAIPAHFFWDVNVFDVWADCFEKYGRQIYIGCTDIVDQPNYPAAGIYFSAVVMSFIEKLTGQYDHMVFRQYLAAVDALNIVLFSFIASTLRMLRPLLISSFLFVCW